MDARIFIPIFSDAIVLGYGGKLFHFYFINGNISLG